jgi:hypothetical protein
MKVRYFALTLVSAGLCLAQVTLPEGTKLRVRLEQTLSSARAEEGQSVELTVAEAVVINGVVLIKDGARATGTITEAMGKRRMGRPGKLDFSIDRVSAVDGHWVPLRYSLLKKAGDSHTLRTGIITAGVALAFWPAAPAMLLMRGKDITINKGVSFDVFTDTSHVVASVAGPAPARVTQLQAAPPAPVALAAPVAPPPPAVVQAAPAEPSIKTPPALASVTITSPTGGADIEVDGNFVGNTPTTLRLPAGKHQITVKKGTLSWQRSVQVTAGGTVSLNATFAQGSVASNR